MRPGLTLLCITRDEAPKLMRLLESCKGIVDEMVVVDTGSKDLSVGVARVAGAKVHEIAWPESFAEAMNCAIPLVETEWTVRLDTDEWLVRETCLPLRKAMREPTAVAYNLIREDVVAEEVLAEAYQLRMWRTDPRLRFEGYIHERVRPELMKEIIADRKIYNLPVRFRHDGYVGGISAEKLRRNIELLRRELAERPGELYYEVDLARSLLALGEPEGRERLNATLELVTRPGQPKQGCVADLFITALQNGVDSDVRNRVIEIAKSDYSDHPPLMWAVALAQKEAGEVPESRRTLEGLVSMMQDPEFMRAHGIRQDAKAAVEAALAEVASAG